MACRLCETSSGEKQSFLTALAGKSKQVARAKRQPARFEGGYIIVSAPDGSAVRIRDDR